MSRSAISGARILAARKWHDNHALICEGGRVSALVPAAELPNSIKVERLAGGCIIAGFIDTQVNGGDGVLFNDAPTVDGIAAIAAAHRRFGTTALLPTLISDDLAVIAKAVEAVDAAIARGVPGVIGIHIEGPFLNAAKSGIHNTQKFRTIDAEAIELLSSLKHGRTLVTLAPECAAPGVIAQLVERGVIVAAGHSQASYEDMVRAAEEGLSGVTHLFNAMSQLESRAPGLVGATIDLNLFSGLIVDAHHVHPATLRSACRAKGVGELMLVTDAMPLVGSEAHGFALGDVWISEKDGALRGPDGTLAGSNLNMALALRNAVEMMHVDLAAASQMASGTPADFLGLSHSIGDLAPGHRADMVHLDDALSLQSTWIGGVRQGEGDASTQL